MLNDLLNEILLEESVNVEDVTNAIDNHEQVIITYQGEDGNADGARLIEVYAYGLTSAGNPVIRCFQPLGDTKTRVPNWKFFRLDRISSWKPTKQTFDAPADERFGSFGKFNKHGDNTMSVVYKVASFNGEEEVSAIQTSQPKLKDGVYKTDTETGLEKLKQQLVNPIKIDDFMKDGKYKKASDYQEPKHYSGPMTKDRTNDEPEVYKTETERRMERLRQQLNNPQTLDDYTTTTQPVNKETQQDNSTTYTVQDFKNKYGKPKDDNKQGTSTEPYKTDTEQGLARLRQQLENPEKIDLSRIPKR